MAKIQSTRHVLAVNDLQEAAAYFIEALGFERDFAAEGWEFLSFGVFKVMLGACPNELPARETNNHSYFAYVVVEDIDELYEQYLASGAAISSAVADQPWSMREFGVVTPEGHRIMFGQELA